jgi:hypothetical protein
MHWGIEICSRVLNTILLNILCICCWYAVIKLSSLLTTYSLSPTVNCAWRIQNTPSAVIDNIFVDENIIHLSSLSPTVNALSDRDVFFSAHCHAICLEWEGIIRCKVLPPRDIYHKLLSYKSDSKLMFLCLLQATTKCTKESVHTLIRSVVLSGRRLWIQNEPQTKFVTS